MYDEENFYYPPEPNYHEDTLREAEEFYRDLYGDGDYYDDDEDDYEDLLRGLEYPF